MPYIFWQNYIQGPLFYLVVTGPPFIFFFPTFVFFLFKNVYNLNLGTSSFFRKKMAKGFQ